MEDLTDLDLRVLDLLREDARSAELLAAELSQGDEQVGVDDVRGSLERLASRGLAHPTGGAPHRAEKGDDDGPLLDEEADLLWEITEGGRAVIEPQSGIARAPYDRTIGDESGGQDAGLWVLLAIAVVTAAAAAYTLLTATGVLGSG